MNFESLRGLDVDQVAQLLAQHESELSLAPAGSDPLDRLDYHLDSFAYLFIMRRRLEIVPTPNLFQKAYQFSLQFTPVQHRLFYVELQKCANFFGTQNNQQCCQILVIMAERLAGGSMFSSIHDIAMYSCLVLKEYRLAIPILEDLSEFNTIDLNSVKSYLKYQYYRGLILLKLREFPKALSAFLTAIYVPGTAMSMIQIEAFKKAVLISLMLEGNLPHLPTDFMTSLNMALKRGGITGNCYQKLARAVEELNFTHVQEICSSYKLTFEEDGNSGLLKLVMYSMVGFKVKEYARIFKSIGINDMETAMGRTALGMISPQSLEQKITKMLGKGKIFGFIKDGILFFEEDPNISRHDFSQLQRDQIEILERLETYDKQLGLDKKYLVTKVARRKSSQKEDEATDEMTID